MLKPSVQELSDALRGILELGRKDTSNPKYDSYYNAAREALGNLDNTCYICHLPLIDCPMNAPFPHDEDDPTDMGDPGHEGSND